MTWQAVCADVLEWCENYTGPKFHAILTDPPYGLEFMGKDWDAPWKYKFSQHGYTDGGKRVAAPNFSSSRNPMCRSCHRHIRGWKGVPGCQCENPDPDTWDKNREDMRRLTAWYTQCFAALAEHLLPGGFVMSFASSRGWHRLACAMEDAGLIIQPSIFGWLNGQSFPKATRIDTQIDKAAGRLEERQKITIIRNGGPGGKSSHIGQIDPNRPSGLTETTLPATDLARAWEGHRYGGQILKNALEPIIVAQKPWEGKRLDCIVETGAGSLNIEAARIGTNEVGQPRDYKPRENRENWRITGGTTGSGATSPQGRWPANFALCHSEGCERVGVKRIRGTPLQANIGKGSGNFSKVYGQAPSIVTSGYADPDGYERVDAWRCVEGCPVARLDEQAGERKSGNGQVKISSGTKGTPGWSEKKGMHTPGRTNVGIRDFGDTGGASRFFKQADWSHEIAERITNADPVRYCPKAARKERDAGLETVEPKPTVDIDKWAVNDRRRGTARQPTEWQQGPHRNPHPTVKPIALCKWLATLLLPPKEYAPRRIAVPFAGSGSEMIAAGLAGWEEIIGVDFKQDYCDIAEARLEHWLNKPKQLELP